MSYQRVIPRDLFNEANLLKCYGQLWLKLGMYFSRSIDPRMNYLYPLAEYRRPWKLVTLALGLAFLFAGALWSGLPDWDIGVSLLMALPAYLTAAPTLRVVMERRWHLWPIAAFWMWLTVDGTYWLYWSLRDPATLDALRHANAAASSALYLMCGLVWYARRPLFWDWPDDTSDDFWTSGESQHH